MYSQRKWLVDRLQRNSLFVIYDTEITGNEPFGTLRFDSSLNEIELRVGCWFIRNGNSRDNGLYFVFFQRLRQWPNIGIVDRDNGNIQCFRKFIVRLIRRSASSQRYYIAKVSIHFLPKWIQNGFSCSSKLQQPPGPIFLFHQTLQEWPSYLLAEQSLNWIKWQFPSNMIIQLFFLIAGRATL